MASGEWPWDNRTTFSGWPGTGNTTQGPDRHELVIFNLGASGTQVWREVDILLAICFSAQIYLEGRLLKDSTKNLYNCALTSNGWSSSQSFLRSSFWVIILKFGLNKNFHLFHK